MIKTIASLALLWFMYYSNFKKMAEIITLLKLFIHCSFPKRNNLFDIFIITIVDIWISMEKLRMNSGNLKLKGLTYYTIFSLLIV